MILLLALLAAPLDHAVVYTAPWCAACQQMPVAQLQQQGFEIIKKEWEQSDNIRVLPTTVFYKDNKEVARYEGLLTEATFKQHLEPRTRAPVPEPVPEPVPVPINWRFY